MAVDIPVIVDIEKSFEDAAKRVKTAIKPLQEVIESAPASLFIDVKIGNSKKVLVELFDDARTSVSSFESALAQVSAKIEKLAAKGGFNLRASGQLTKEEKNLLEAAGLLETKLKGVGNASSAMSRVFSLNMKKAEEDISNYMHQLDALQRKQNLSARVSSSGGLTKPYQAQIDAVNVKLQETRRFLGYCSLELEKVSSSGVKATAAMGGMKTKAQEMAEAWRRGESYLARYNAGLESASFRMGTLVKNALSLMAIHAASSFIRNVREVTSEFEMQRVALGGIIQDTERAEKLFKQLKAAAIQSPFQIKDLVTFTKQLSAYRIETENLFDVTMKLADVSAGLGVDMNRLVLAYGQVRAASVLRGQELRQFTEAGIPLVEELARKFRELGREGTTTADVFELISQRAVPFKMIEDIFNDMTKAGGIFYKMQEKQSETLKGQWMKLRDALSIMYDEIGNTSAVHGAMEVMLRSAKELLENWREVGKTLGVVITSLAAYKVAIINLRISQNALTAAEAAQISALELNTIGRSRLIAVMLGEEKAMKLQVFLSNLYVAAKRRETMATNIFTKALWKMNAALLKNPYAAAAAVIIVLVAAIYKLVKRTKEAKATVESLQKTIAAYDKTKESVKDIQDLCQAYTELSAKLERTKDEEDKLARVTKELAKAYPGAISGINKETEALKINTKAIQEENAAKREAMGLALEKQKTDIESELKPLQDEYDYIMETLTRGTVRKGAYGGVWEEVLTEDQKARLGDRLLYLQERMAGFKEQIDAATKSLEDFTGVTAGPPLPDFFNEKWKLRLASYKTMLSGAVAATRAFENTELEQFKTAQEAAEKTAEKYNKLAAEIQFYSNALKTAKGQDAEYFAKQKANAEAMLSLYGLILTDFNAWDMLKKNGSGGDKLSGLKNSISDITNAYKKYLELLKYMSKEDALKNIDTLFPSLAGWEPTYENMLERLENLITAYRGNADATRLIEQAIANVKFDKLRDDIKDELSRLSNEIKHSKEAKSFYDNLLDMTGNEDLARKWTEKIYGTVGEEAENRQKELLSKLFTFDSSRVDVSGELQGVIAKAISEKDVVTLRKYLGDIVDANKSAAESIVAEWERDEGAFIQNWEKTYAKAKTFQERIDDINRKRKVAKDEAEGKGISTSGLAAMDAYYNKEVAKVTLEVLKSAPEWKAAFEDMGSVGEATLRKLIVHLTTFKNLFADALSPEDLKAITEAITRSEEGLAKKNPFLTMSEGFSEYVDARMKLANIDKESDPVLWAKYKDKEAEAIKKMQDSVQGLSNVYSSFSGILSNVKQLLDVDETSEFGAALDGVASSLEMVGVALVAINAILTLMETNPIVLAISAVVAAGAAIAKALSGIKSARMEKEIQKQKKLVDDLSAAYDKLSKVIDNAFGSDYVATNEKMIKNLEAQQKAYEKQAEAESKKGKKTDDDKVREYRKAARDTAEQILELREKVAEFFAGQDLTSAAESFASAWREAYAEFGDTADAIKEKMEDMIHNLIEKAAMAGIVQAVLKPWYDELNRLTPEEVDSERIAELIGNAYALIPTLNEGLAIATSNLEAAGVNMRQAAGNFSGISRDYATATEGAINGLAAGVNTQNFYISHVPEIAQNVALILAALNGSLGRPEAPSAGVSEPKYMSFLPEMHSDLHEIRLMLAKVISPNGVASNTHYVATR